MTFTGEPQSLGASKESNAAIILKDAGTDQIFTVTKLCNEKLR